MQTLVRSTDLTGSKFGFIAAKVNDVIGCAAIVSLIVLPRSYLFLKFSLLALFSVSSFLSGATLMLRRIPVSLIILFTAISCIGLIWSLLGLIGGGFTDGAIDSFRLYVLWSAVWLVLSVLIIHAGAEIILHKSFIVSALLIFAINALGFFDAFFGAGLISDNVRRELDLYVGFHEGYTQITSHNIGSIFFLINYFFVVLMSSQRPHFWRIAFVYFLLVILMLASGRRGLWGATFVCHLMVILHGFFSFGLFSRKAIRGFIAIAVVLALCGVSLLLQYTSFSLDAFQLRLADSFSANDERSLQAPFLLKGFVENFVFGSGFGVSAGYTRNEERPWIYEMVFHQLLFNLGLVGFVFVSVVAAWIVVRSVRLLVFCGRPVYLLGSLYGCLAFAIGCYSNPYIGSFDFLIYIWILPLLNVSYRRNRKLEWVLK